MCSGVERRFMNKKIRIFIERWFINNKSIFLVGYLGDGIFYFYK